MKKKFLIYEFPMKKNHMFVNNRIFDPKQKLSPITLDVKVFNVKSFLNFSVNICHEEFKAFLN